MWTFQIRHLPDSGTATRSSIKKSLRNRDAEQSTTIPASWAFTVTMAGGKCNKHRKTSGDNDKRSNCPSKPDIQCWYCAHKVHTHNDCNFEEASNKLKEKNELTKPASVAAASMNEFTNNPYAIMACRNFLGDSDHWLVGPRATNLVCCDKHSFNVYHSLNCPKTI